MKTIQEFIEKQERLVEMLQNQALDNPKIESLAMLSNAIIGLKTLVDIGGDRR